MSQSTNTYIAVNPLWSYNFVGGLKEYVELDMGLLDNAYQLVSTYLIYRANFHKNHLKDQYNLTIANLYNQADALGIPVSYFQFYCDCLFRDLLICFNQIPGFLKTITPISNNQGDIIGFVIEHQYH